jgi:hypothetical protein
VEEKKELAPEDATRRDSGVRQEKLSRESHA